MDLATILAAREAYKANGNWYPACGGTEVPFRTRSGKWLEYCYQPSTGRHAYRDVESDIMLTDMEAEAYLMRS